MEVSEREGTNAKLVQRGSDVDLAWFEGVGTLGLTAGASAPELLVREVVNKLSDWFDVREEIIESAKERMIFKLPRSLEAV